MTEKAKNQFSVHRLKGLFALSHMKKIKTKKTNGALEPSYTHLPYGPEFLERLPGSARVDQYESVALGHGQPLHGGELMRPRRVGDLQRADVLVAADHLPVRVLDGRYVRLAERALDEPEHQRALAHAARAENHHPVIVALFRHCGVVAV